MCRHLGWFGAPRSLSELILAPDHGLATQSWAPRRQAHGTVNADGWGVGFFPTDAAGHPAGHGPASASEPVRWRTEKPLWTDTNFASVAPHLRSGRVVAAVRSATVGMPLDASAAAPFSHDGWLVSHNGRVDRGAVGASLVAESTCDAALLAARVVGEGVDRVGRTLAGIAAVDPAARMNLLLVSSERLLATTWGDTLSYLERPDGFLVASEPDDSPGWVDVADRSLVTVSAAGLTVTPLST